MNPDTPRTPRDRFSPRPVWLLTLAALMPLACSSSGEVPVHPISGKVFFQGRPVAEATVVLHSKDGSPQRGQRPLAYTDAQGQFALTTTRPSDGAPPGDYVVTVVLRAPVTVGDERVREGRHLLPTRYSRPETSPLRLRVEPGENQEATLSLK